MFLLIDNYDSFTFNLVQAFYSLGKDALVVRNDDPSLLQYALDPELEGVCISPGPGHPDAAGLCLDFLKRLPVTVPVLGVCLGHQVLGRFAGASVTVAAEIVHGKASDIIHDGTGLFKDIPCPMRAGRYHSLLVRDSGQKTPLRITARTSAGEVMGLSYADRPWSGVQFHPESVLTPDGVHLLGNFVASMTKKAATGKTGETGETVKTAPTVAAAQTGPAPFPLSDIIEALARKENLLPVMAKAAFSRLMDGELTPAQAGAFLMGLRAKGETPEEMHAAVNAILERAVTVDVPQDTPVLDIVGTGGDGRFSFNCSSGTALILSALGHRIVKHGNRSVSSKCGSADVLEGLGFNLELSPEFSQLMNIKPIVNALPDLILDDPNTEGVKWDFLNVWDRENLFIHASFVTYTSRQYLGRGGEFYYKPSKIYYFGNSSQQFYLWVSFNGIDKVKLYYENFIIELALLLDSKHYQSE
jgi:anthranilate synthase/phosphoribosyltransferase